MRVSHIYFRKNLMKILTGFKTKSSMFLHLFHTTFWKITKAAFAMTTETTSWQKTINSSSFQLSTKEFLNKHQKHTRTRLDRERQTRRETDTQNNTHKLWHKQTKRYTGTQKWHSHKYNNNTNILMFTNRWPKNK